jgi:hypothetical protein
MWRRTYQERIAHGVLRGTFPLTPLQGHDPASQPKDELEGSASFRAAPCPIERVLVIHVTLATPATGPPDTTAFAGPHQRHRRDGAHCKYRIDNRSDSDGGDCSAPVQFSVGTRSMWSITTTSTCCLRRSNLNPREPRRAKKMSVVGGLGRPRNRSSESGSAAA